MASPTTISNPSIPLSCMMQSLEVSVPSIQYIVFKPNQSHREIVPCNMAHATATDPVNSVLGDTAECKVGNYLSAGASLSNVTVP